MYVIDGIAYAGEREPLLKVVEVKSLGSHRLWLRFSNGEERLYDATQLLHYPLFQVLSDPWVFDSVYLDCGVPTWCTGKIDIAPETLYKGSVEWSGLQ